MSSSGPATSGEVPTVLVKDRDGHDLLCFLEQLIPLDDKDYALLTPVDTPVCLFRLRDGDDPELIDSITSSEPILSVADVVLQEHELTLVRSAVTLTVSPAIPCPPMSACVYLGGKRDASPKTPPWRSAVAVPARTSMAEIV